jgi:hypothetical protein
MKNEEKLALAFVLLLSFSLAAYNFTSLHMLDINSYSELLLAKDAVAGKLSSPTPLLYQLTAFLYNMFNSGGTGFNTGLMLTIAKVLPIIFSLVCVVSFYFMLKSMFSDIAAVGGAVVLVSSLPFITTMGSGFYTADALGMCLFTAACSAFFLFYKSRNYLLLLASALLFFISGMSWQAGWVMIGVVLLSLLAQLAYSWKKKLDEPLAHGAAAVLVAFLLAYFIFPQESIFSSMNTTNLLQYTTSIPLAVVGIFAFISWLIGKHKRRSEFGVFAASFFVLSVVVLLFQYFPAALGVALFSAFAINELLELKNENLALILLACTLFFVSFLFSVNFLETDQSILASAGIALTSAFIAALYRERRVVVYITFSVIALFLFSSMIAAVMSVSQRQEVIGSGADEVISWMNYNLPDNATVWAFEVSPVIEFTTGRSSYSNDTEFASFILSNDSTAFLKSRNVTYIIMDTSLFDSIDTLKVLANNTRVDITSFTFYGRGASGGTLYGIFLSADGDAAYVQLDPITGSPVGDSVRITTKDGSAMLIPIENFLSAGSGRLIYPEDNYRVNLFNLFFGQVSGLKQVYVSSTGDIEVYEVVD